MFGRLAILLFLICGNVSALDTHAFFEKYCFECHDRETRKGGLDLTTLHYDAAKPEKWIQVYDAIADGEMPPAKKKLRPSAVERDAFVTELRTQLANDITSTHPHHMGLRRLTRQEFENSLKDLLALPHLDIISLLPADGRVAGYDKIGNGLDLSPGHLAAYQEAVEKALDLAIATQSTPPRVYHKRIYPAGLFKFGGNLAQGQFVLLKDKQPDPALPVRGGFEYKKGYVGDEGPDLAGRGQLVKSPAVAQSQSAVGLLNPNLAGYEAAMNVSPIYAGNYRLRLSIWGFRWANGHPNSCDAPQAGVLRAHEEGKQQEGGRLLSTFTAPSMESKEGEIVAWLDAHESIVFDPVSVPWNGLRIGQIAGRAAKHVGPGVALDWFEIEGPLNPTWPPTSHTRLFGKLPIKTLVNGTTVIPPRREKIRSIPGYLPSIYFDLTPAEREPKLETVQSENSVKDAHDLLVTFLPQAFRRDVTESEIEPYLKLLQTRLEANDCFEDAMRRVYVAILTSPEFLFLPRLTDDNALASRLAYWLWDGPPDEALLATARNHTLHRPEVLRTQVDRLLGDPRAERFIQNFAKQWLELHRLDETNPDPLLYPEYSYLLGQGVAAETPAFLRELIMHNQPAGSLLKPDFAMLTQRLAEHYGISGVTGVEIRKVPLPPNSLRGGLLGQAAIHKLTANGTTTSPVKRGVWVSDRLLDRPPPPPPPGVSAVDPDTRGATTIREQLSKHRNNPNCIACHAKIDAPGFALESFDPIGGQRLNYRSNGQGDTPPEKGHTNWKIEYKIGKIVNASGELRDGRTFKDTAQFIDLLAADDVTIAQAFVGHLARYATGSDINFADRAEIHRIVMETKKERYGLRSLIHALAQSPLFLPN